MLARNSLRRDQGAGEKEVAFEVVVERVERRKRDEIFVVEEWRLHVSPPSFPPPY
jgi:hypothetical protein